MKKAVLENERKPLPYFKRQMIQDIKNNTSSLSDFINLSRVDRIFTDLVTTNASIGTAIQDESNYNHPKTIDYYFTYDKLLWKSQISYSYFQINNIKFKGVDFTLVNDGFIYTLNNCDDTTKNQYHKHGSDGWFKIEDPHKKELANVFKYIQETLKLSSNNPQVVYSYAHDRLEIQIKEYKSKLACSITFEYGAPCHDFDDCWEDDADMDLLKIK